VPTTGNGANAPLSGAPSGPGPAAPPGLGPAAPSGLGPAAPSGPGPASPNSGAPVSQRREVYDLSDFTSRDLFELSERAEIPASLVKDVLKQLGTGPGIHLMTCLHFPAHNFDRHLDWRGVLITRQPPSRGRGSSHCSRC
jgi:hypothetical protein